MWETHLPRTIEPTIYKAKTVAFRQRRGNKMHYPTKRNIVEDHGAIAVSAYICTYTRTVKVEYHGPTVDKRPAA